MKRIVLFPRPVDRDAFHRDYESGYVAASERLPGLLRWRCTVPLGDDASRPYHVIGECYFKSAQALEAALESEAGHAFLAVERALSTGGAPDASLAIEHESGSGNAHAHGDA